jgi:type IV fimbrial biogenesis protein FimT
MVELVVAIGIVMILMAIAVPSFSDSRLSSQLRASSLELVASTNLARSEAIKRNTTVTLCVSSNGESCGSGGWHQGWIVTSGGEVIYRSQAIDSGFHINAAGGATSFTFQSTGVDATAGSFTVCRASPSAGRQERVVTVNAVGRAMISKTATGTCS